MAVRTARSKEVMCPVQRFDNCGRASFSQENGARLLEY